MTEDRKGDWMQTYTGRKGDWMQTYTGRKVWPLDIEPRDVHIEDIAHSLSMQCRYNGHCLRFYSVAEHSVLIARAALPQHKLYALLHDAAEAYLTDVPRPLKPWLVDYYAMEANADNAIMRRFGLGPQPNSLASLLDVEAVRSAVKELDERILVDERAQIMAPGLRWKGIEDVEPLRVVIEGWPPEKAEQEFLFMFHSLTNTKVPE